MDIGTFNGNYRRTRKRAIALACLVLLVTLAPVFGPQTARAATPTSTPDPSGTHHIDYVVHHASSCPQPPAAMEGRLALSDTDLQRYGLPMRQQFSSQAEWQHVVGLVKQRVCDTTTILYDGKALVNDRANNIWGGWAAYCFTSFSAVTSYWYVPCTQYSFNDSASTWTGIGGTRDQYLMQTGTKEKHFWGSTLYYAWFENRAGAEWREQSVFNVHCGDFMYAYVSGNYYDILDTNSGASSANWYGPLPDNTTVEWMQERNDTSVPLANYGAVSFHHTQVENVYGNWADQDQYLNVRYTPSDPVSGHQLEYALGFNPDASYGDTFSVGWENGN